MKHYSNEEFTRADKGFFKAETLRQLKRIGHGRERAALKRELLAECAEYDNDRTYWERELKSAIAEFADLRDAEFNEKWFYEVYGVGYDADWYEDMFLLYVERITTAENELAAMAA